MAVYKPTKLQETMADEVSAYMRKNRCDFNTSAHSVLDGHNIKLPLERQAHKRMIGHILSTRRQPSAATVAADVAKLLKTTSFQDALRSVLDKRGIDQSQRGYYAVHVGQELNKRRQRAATHKREKGVEKTSAPEVVAVPEPDPMPVAAAPARPPVTRRQLASQQRRAAKAAQLSFGDIPPEH